MADLAIILIAHGARDPRWAAPFRAVQQQLQAARPDARVELAFLELMTPTLEEAATQAAARGARRLVLAPLFLGQGGHMREDLPALIAKLRQRLPQVELEVLPSIGEAPEVLEAVTSWVLRRASG